MKVGCNMSNILEVLQECIETKHLIDVYRLVDLEETITGFVEQVSDELVCIVKIAEDGSFDGRVVFKIDTISRIRWDNTQLQLIANLMKKRSLPNLNKINMSSFLTAMESLNNDCGYVSLYQENLDVEVCFIGQLLQMGKFLRLHEYGSLDEMNRSFLILQYADTTRVEAGGKYENNLVKTYKNYQN